jgi:hypothetical protein
MPFPIIAINTIVIPEFPEKQIVMEKLLFTFSKINDPFTMDNKYRIFKTIKLIFLFLSKNLFTN